MTMKFAPDGYLYMIAGNRREAVRAAGELNIPAYRIRHIDTAQSLLGLRDITLYVVGTASRRRDFSDFMAEALVRKFEVIPLPEDTVMTRDNHPHRAGRYTYISFLATAPEEQLMKFQAEAMFVVELFDRRGQTVRCRAHGDDTDRGQRAYDAALEIAKRHDVTIQDLCEAGGDEHWPVVHLGTHGLKWPNKSLGCDAKEQV